MFRICFIIVLLISLAIPFQVNAKSMNFETLLKDLPVPQSSVIEIGFGVFNNKNEEFAFACANKDTELGKEGKIYIKKIKTGEKWKLFNSDEGITNAKIVDVDSDGIVEILVIRQGGMGNIMTVEIIREKDIYYFPKSFKNGVAEIIVNSGQLDKIVINHEINLPVPPPRYGLASFLKYNNKKAELEIVKRFLPKLKSDEPSVILGYCRALLLEDRKNEAKTLLKKLVRSDRKIEKNILILCKQLLVSVK